jgi:predicted ATPase
VVLATSRRPLHLPGEQERPVPPLGLPGEAGVAEVAACGATRLFIQQAAMVRPGFALTAANAADVAAICWSRPVTWTTPGASTPSTTQPSQSEPGSSWTARRI